MSKPSHSAVTRKYLGHYEPRYSRFFEKQMKKVGSAFFKRVETKIGDLRQDPYHNAPFGKGKWRGKRYVYISRKDRLFFAICEECKSEKHQRFNQCLKCDDTPDYVFVVFCCIFGHDYKRGWK